MENLNPETNLLADDFKRSLEYATPGQRFVNYLVDMVAFYLIVVVVGVVIVLMNGDTSAVEDLENSSPILNQLFWLIMFVAYMTLLEGLGKGKTLGKVFTRTRAVYEDGTKINFSTALLRTLSRLVPFEAFSAFGGHPWHDQWTKTRVVKDESLPA